MGILDSGKDGGKRCEKCDFVAPAAYVEMCEYEIRRLSYKL